MSDTPAHTHEPTRVTTEPVPDMQLQLLVRLLAQDPGSSLPMTLSTPGGIVYGDVIAHETWKADWAMSLHRMDGSGAQTLARFPELVDQAIGEMSGSDTPQSLPQWIRLRDVTLVHGPQSMTSPLWRGRLADVSGWSLGKPA
ncbi:hypothetical protein ACFWU3_32705 [Streptomyces sp. NPDC058685]|uniref:hypothetical protein n=1 Tax=Streptomyces sp. NPDC058685 TaxID=3346598 RepID=UPI003651FEFA